MANRRISGPDLGLALSAALAVVLVIGYGPPGLEISHLEVWTGRDAPARHSSSTAREFAAPVHGDPHKESCRRG